jgi:hypothetical protein
MTGTELLAIAIGLGAGYWLVTKLLSRNEGASAPPDRQAPAPTADRPAMTPPWHHVLELAPDASADEIRAAYLTLMDQARADKARADDIAAAYEEAVRSRNAALRR